MANDTLKGRPKFVYVTYIRSTREKVFQALTDGAATREYWSGYRIESDWKVGGPLRFYDGDDKLAHDDKVLAFDPPSLLSYGWKPLRKAFEGETESRVTFTLEQAGEHVKLTMVHDEMMPGGKMLNAVSGGWPVVLSSLKSLLETGAPLGDVRPSTCE
jgi:uncharacterized protein YndB with AHSA1/START domain